MLTPKIHLINPLEHAAGGSEWRALMLYDLLRPHADVHLWTEFQPDPRLPQNYPIERISVEDGLFPQGGTFVFVGFYRQPGAWVHRVKSDRTILIYNTPNHKKFGPVFEAISSLQSPVEIVYAAKWLRERAGYPGPIHPSLIDLNRFSLVRCYTARNKFCVGRLSHDRIRKHYMPDIEMYERIASKGMCVKIMGGMILEEKLGNTPGIELLPSCAMPAEAFLGELDCFYYRTSEKWIEPFGRVVMEAMATGLPVVAHRHGGYAEWIIHGQNGFLFDTQEEAEEILLILKNDLGLRKTIGINARKTMEDTYSNEARKEMLRFYLGYGKRNSFRIKDKSKKVIKNIKAVYKAIIKVAV